MDLRRTTVLLRADLARRVRNRSAIVTALVAPLALAAVFQSLIGAGGTRELRIAVVDLDRSTVSASIASALWDGGDTGPVRFLSLPEATSLAAVDRAVDGGDAGAAIVFAPGFGAALEDPGATATPARLEVRQAADATLTGQIAASVAAEIAAEIARRDLAARLGAPPKSDGAVAPAFTLVDTAPGGREVSAAAFFGASMAILFLFLTVSFGARAIHQERAAGTLDRMLTTPASAAEIVIAKTASVSLLGLASFVVVWVTTDVVFGAPWGNPLAVAVLIVATVVAVGGVATFVASLARTERQADSLTAVVAFTLALLGGNFIQPGAAPALLQRLSLLTPNGWALRAFAACNADASTLADIAGTVTVLVAFGMLTGSAGLARARRSLVR